YQPSYDIVNIHWPEALFDWYEPTPGQLDELEKSVEIWKKNSIIVYTKHDSRRHKGMTSNFERLFKMIEENTDVFIHLGNYSKSLYEKEFPAARHEIVFHPLYTNSYSFYSREEARKDLGIDKDAMVIIAPGNIRHLKERK